MFEKSPLLTSNIKINLMLLSLPKLKSLQAESAIAALNCSGAVLGSLPIRVSPSKTPVRPRTTRPTMN
ncbi:hypothetical protein Hanom_Chr03g00272801 [Helianthus anomalus]